MEMTKVITEHYSLNRNDVEIYEKIDEGSFGTVFRGTVWGQPVAVKCCPVRKQADRNDFVNEVQMLQRSQHPNVVTLFGFHMGSKENILVQEWMEHGSLTAWLQTHFQSVDNAREKLLPIFKRVAFCLAVALNWIHHKGLIHRDVKPDNILLHYDQIKLCDFGLACEMKVEPNDILPVSSSSSFSSPTTALPAVTQPKNTKKRKIDSLLVPDNSMCVVRTKDHHEQAALHGFAGTASMQAPEVIQENSYDSKCDVFSFAMTLCYMFRGQDPYVQTDGEKVNIKIKDGQRPPIPRYVPSGYVQLIRQCWKQDPKERPTMRMVLQTLCELNAVSPSSSSIIGWSGTHGFYWRIRLRSKKKSKPEPQSSKNCTVVTEIQKN